MSPMQSVANQHYRKCKNACMNTLAVACALLVISPLGFVLFYLIRQGASSVNWAFFTNLPAPVGQIGGGMGNAIVGTLELLLLASLVGVPVGVLGGIYLSEYGGDRINDWIRFWADVLNGIPSIVWGIVAYGLVVIPMKGFSAYAGGLALSFMMIPLILRTTEEVLVLVPRSYREAALALGLPQWKTVVRIVLPTALKGIVTGVLLAMARVAGETAPLMFTAFGNDYWNHKLAQPVAALPLQIFKYAISPYDDWHRQAWAGALVLMAIILTINIVVRIISRGYNKSN
jgi:phosphate transport system permease protein